MSTPIKYFEDDHMVKLERAMCHSLSELNRSILSSIGEGFADNETLNKPRDLFDILLNAYRNMVQRDIKDD